ncbi:hypothetical protein FJY63_02680 [Candidatus Sumerlaeota bacterium]|nr:hypothetical protein [Candidatus Sumerlaeota bacterium]
MAAEHLGEQAESLVRRLIVEFCTGTFRGDNRTRDMALQLIESRQEWKTRFEQAQTAPDGNLDSIRPVIFLVTANEKPIGSIVIPSDATGGSLGLIAPGRHSLVLETGRMIWAGRLSSSHLLLQAAFQEEPLRMAADTEALSAQPTLVVSLLDGDAFLRVYPGFEAGRLEVELRQRPCHGGER